MRYIKIRFVHAIRGKARPRWNGRYMFTPANTREFEEELQTLIFNSLRENNPTNNPFSIYVIAKHSIPVSWKLDKKRAALSGDLPCIGKNFPDYDNVLKIVSDSLNNVIYEDDRQVVECYFKREFVDDLKDDPHLIIFLVQHDSFPKGIPEFIRNQLNILKRQEDIEEQLDNFVIEQAFPDRIDEL